MSSPKSKERWTRVSSSRVRLVYGHACERPCSRPDAGAKAVTEERRLALLEAAPPNCVDCGLPYILLRAEVKEPTAVVRTPRPARPPSRLITEGGGCGLCKICGSTLKHKHLFSGEVECIQPDCMSRLREREVDPI
jgi:hypothetical protein